MEPAFVPEDVVADKADLVKSSGTFVNHEIKEDASNPKIEIEEFEGGDVFEDDLKIDSDYIASDEFIFPGLLDALLENINLQSVHKTSKPITDIISGEIYEGDGCIFQVVDSEIAFDTEDPIGIALHMPKVDNKFRQSSFFPQFSVCDYDDSGDDYALEFGNDARKAAIYISNFLITYFGFSKDSSFAYKTWDDETGFDSLSNSAPLLSQDLSAGDGAKASPENAVAGSVIAAQASVSPQEVQRSGVPVSLVVILLMVTAAFVAIFAFAWSSDPSGGEDAQVVSVYVSGRANARDQPTAEGSSILATYDVGTELSGTWVSGASDASEQWLKFEVDGQARYIWSRNLSVVRSDVPSENEKAIASIDPAEALDFVKKYVFATNSSSGLWASDVVNTYYDDQVLYFGKTVDRSYVLGEKVRYERRWPDRTYQIMEDTVQTDCQSTPGVCSISGTMWYSATSEERGAHGEGYAEFTLGVKMTTSGLRISSETSKVVGN